MRKRRSILIRMRGSMKGRLNNDQLEFGIPKKTVISNKYEFEYGNGDLHKIKCCGRE